MPAHNIAARSIRIAKGKRARQPDISGFQRLTNETIDGLPRYEGPNGHGTETRAAIERGNANCRP